MKNLIIPLTGAFLLNLLTSSPSSAHTFQTNLYPDIELKRDHLAIELWIATFLFPPFEHLSFDDGKVRPTKTEAGGKIESFFNKTCPISINDQRITPQLEWVKFEEMDDVSHLGETTDLTMAKIMFRYPVNEEVRNIKVGWGLWFPEEQVTVKDSEAEQSVSHDPNILDMLIFVEGEAYPLYLTKAEPEFIWHAGPRTFSETPAIDQPNQAEGHFFKIPILSILIALIGILLVFKYKWTSMAHRFAIIAVTVTSSFITKGVMNITIPYSESKLAPKLSEKGAEDTFSRLHRGIYRAFESESEDAIYNTLAQSVTENLLPPLYEEIYQSLILRDEGGAISRVNRIEYLNTKATKQNEGRSFDIECAWQVHGIVRHWGHSHLRSNEYEAEYTLAMEGKRWKIASSSVNLQKRVKAPKTSEPQTSPDKKS